MTSNTSSNALVPTPAVLRIFSKATVTLIFCVVLSMVAARLAINALFVSNPRITPEDKITGRKNTDHPTQKPEKLYAKLILASSKPGDTIFDPFLGSGTSSVVAKKLKRNYCGIELNEEYCLWAEKRLQKAESDTTIQGYYEGVFWERNSHPTL